MHRVSDRRACGAVTVAGGASGSNVFVNGKVPAVVGDRDTHTNLGALINIIPHNVNIGSGLLTAIPAFISMASPDQVGIMTHPGGLPIPIQGSPNVFVGSGAASGGIGMMQKLLGGGFGGLSIGELVSAAGQIVGTVQNFVSLGGGSGLAQLNNLQGPLLTPGTSITGQTSGYAFTYQFVFDSRAGQGANNYGDIATVTNALVTDSGDYIAIQDYFDYVYDDNTPMMNLTASVITT